jgi:hypothetical protein
VGGNALVEAGTFVAILLGTLCGGLLAGAPHGDLWIAGGGILVAFAGYLTSRGVPPAPAPEPGLRINPNPFTETWRNIGFARENRPVFLAILGISWFWLYGALFLAQFPAYAKGVLGGGEGTVTLLLATFTVGIGLGSLLCEKLSGGHVEIGLVPFGSIGLTLFGLDIALASPGTLPADAPLAIAEVLAQPGMLRVLLALTLLGVFGGFFIVPLYAMMQSRSAPGHRARVIAANNILNALFMVVGALVAGRAARCRAVHAHAVRRGRYHECSGGLLHLPAGAGIPAAFHRLAAGPHGLSAAHRRAGAHPRRRAGGDRLQPCELRRCAGDRCSFTPADPLRDGSPHLSLAGAVLRLPS